MMGRRPRADATYKNFIHQHKLSYLDRTKSAGGWKDGWKTELRRDLLAGTDTTREALVEVGMLAADAEWDSKPPPGRQLSLFSVAGFEIQETYTFPDPEVKGGYRRVLGRYATPFHMIKDAEIHQTKARQSVDAADRDMEAALAALTRCGGDQFAALWDARDAEAA
jgi:hypothetical protein